MRIAQIAPLTESVPPRLYGGTERVVAHLTDELVRIGHDVTLFASGDSRTKAHLVASWPRALRLDAACRDHLAPHMLMLAEVARRSRDFDVLHFHISQIHFPLMRYLDVAHVTTLHGRLDFPELAAVYREFPEMPVVSISDAQRRDLPHAGWVGTVYHGYPPALFTPRLDPGGYLAFIGRISPEKGADRAIQIAIAAGQKLKIAAKIDPVDRQYFESQVEPLLGHPLIEFIGEIGEQQKNEFLGNATALLFPIDWPEPFGLVMIEALACAVPVIAFRRGSVPEVIDDGITGFIVDGVDEAARAARDVHRLDRARCRMTFEERFTAARMTADYQRVYHAVIERRAVPLQAGR